MIVAPLLCLVFASARADITPQIELNLGAVRQSLSQHQSVTGEKNDAKKALALFDKTKKKLAFYIDNLHVTNWVGGNDFIANWKRVCSDAYPSVLTIQTMTNTYTPYEQSRPTGQQGLPTACNGVKLLSGAVKAPLEHIQNYYGDVNIDSGRYGNIENNYGNVNIGLYGTWNAGSSKDSTETHISNIHSHYGNVNIGSGHIEDLQNNYGITNMVQNARGPTYVGSLENNGGIMNMVAKLSADTRMSAVADLKQAVDNALKDEDAEPKVKKLLETAVVQTMLGDNGKMATTEKLNERLRPSKREKKTLCVFTPDRKYCVTQQKHLS